jgi:hypothetical protein
VMSYIVCLGKSLKSQWKKKEEEEKKEEGMTCLDNSSRKSQKWLEVVE